MSDRSENSYQPNNRKFPVTSNPWLPYIGDCRALQKYLKSKQGIGWLIPKYLNALFRGISQVAFANNPLAGFIILVALSWANVWVGLAAVVAASTAILTAVDPVLISSGLTTYNAVLVGTITSSLWTPLYGEALGLTHWSFIILGAALSVFVTSAFANMLSSTKIALPALTVPFNVMAVLIFVILMPSHPKLPEATEPVALGLHQSPELISSSALHNAYDDTFKHAKMSRISRQVQVTTSAPDITDTDSDKPEVLNWGKIMLGIILSAGQVYGVEDLLGSILIYIGIMVYSPMLFMMSVFGAILGTICGTCFAPAEAIYSGLWGYNGLLSASSVGGFFIVLTCHSFWNAMANVVFTVLIQQVLAISFSNLHLPVFTLPFVLSTLLFLSVSTSGNQLPRVGSITYPEMHRYLYRHARQTLKTDAREQLVDEIPDEKYPVLTDVKVINEELVEAVVESRPNLGSDKEDTPDA